MNNYQKGTIAQSIPNRVHILDGSIPLPPDGLGWGPKDAGLEDLLGASGPYASSDPGIADILRTGGLRAYGGSRMTNALGMAPPSPRCGRLP